jgi:hypothetical protein
MNTEYQRLRCFAQIIWRERHDAGLRRRELAPLGDLFSTMLSKAQQAGQLTGLERQRLEQEAKYRPEPAPKAPRAPKTRRERKAARMLYVAVYSTNRAFGGPEEGGWWYDCGYPVGRHTTFFNGHHARELVNTLNDACRADNEARGPYGQIGSVLCDYALEAMLTQHPPRPYPDVIPRYE